MLVLTRKANEQILIGDDIKITLLRVRGNSIRLGIDAPREVRIVRGELDVRESKSDATIEMDLDDLIDPSDSVPVDGTRRSIFVGRVHRPKGLSRSGDAPLSRFLSPR